MRGKGGLRAPSDIIGSHEHWDRRDTRSVPLLTPGTQHSRPGRYHANTIKTRGASPLTTAPCTASPRMTSLHPPHSPLAAPRRRAGSTMRGKHWQGDTRQRQNRAVTRWSRPRRLKCQLLRTPETVVGSPRPMRTPCTPHIPSPRSRHTLSAAGARRTRRAWTVERGRDPARPRTSRLEE